MSNQAMCAVWSLNGMLHGKNVFPLCLKTILIKMNSIYPAKRQERIKSCLGRCLWSSALIGSREGPCVCVCVCVCVCLRGALMISLDFFLSCRFSFCSFQDEGDLI